MQYYLNYVKLIMIIFLSDMTDLHKYTHLYTALIALLASKCVIGIDPLTFVGSIGAASIGAFFGLPCKFRDCCDDNWIVNDFTSNHDEIYFLHIMFLRGFNIIISRKKF